MSNDIRIVVSGENRSKSAIQDTRREVTGLQTNVQQAAATLKTSMASLDKQLDETQREVAKLGEEFLRTGSKDVYQKLRDNRSVIANLRQIKRELELIDAKDVDVEVEVDQNRFKDRLKSIGSKTGEILSASMKPMLIAGIVGAAAVAAGQLGPALVAGAAATGGLGLGALVLKDRGPVKRAGLQLVADLKSVLTDAAEPMVAPLLGAFKRFTSGLKAEGPILREIFEASIPAIDALSRGVLDFVRGFLPGFKTAIQNSGPVVEALAESFGQLGRDMGTALEILTDNSEESADALVTVAKALGDILIVTAKVIDFVGDMNKLSESTDGWAKALGKVWDTTAFTGFKAIGGSFEWLSEKIEGTKNPLSASADHARTWGRQMKHAGEATSGFTSELEELYSAVIALSDADIAFQQAIDDMTESIKENGKTLNINTQAGRDNRTALNEIATAALGAAAAVTEMGGSQQDANGKLEDGYSAFVKAARGAGMSKRAAHDLAIEYGLLPKAKTTDVKARGAKGARSDVRNLRGEMNRLRDKTVTLTLRQVYLNYGGESAARGRYQQAGLGHAHGGIVGAASGGIRGGLVKVGEQGEELAELPAGSKVYNNDQSKKIMSDIWRNGTGGEAKEVVVRFDLTGADEGLKDWIKSVVKVDGGGNVQSAFGKG